MTVDATNQTLGRLASQIAILLRGKNSVHFTMNKLPNNIVTITNANKLRFTGKKLSQKIYFRYSGYPGGIREKKLSMLFKTNPELLIKNTVYQMLPKNRSRSKIIKNLNFK